MLLSYLLYRRKQKKTREFLISKDYIAIVNFLIYKKTPNVFFFQHGKQMLALKLFRLITSC